MLVRFFFLLACLVIINTAQAQAVYELSWWYYPQVFGSLDTTPAKARKGHFILESYNDKDQLIKSETYSSTGALTHRTEYIMNEAGLPQTELAYNYSYPLNDSNYLRRKNFIYNEQGMPQIASWCRQNKKDGWVPVTETYTYDSAGRLLQKKNAGYKHLSLEPRDLELFL